MPDKAPTPIASLPLPIQAETSETSPLCPHCRITTLPPDHPSPVCGECREKLRKRPFPVWIQTVACTVALVVGFAFLQVPSALKAGLEYKRGQVAHAFPSTGDTGSLWATFKEPGTPWYLKGLLFPLISLIFLGAIGFCRREKAFGLDLSHVPFAGR